MLFETVRGLASMEPLDRPAYRMLLDPLEDEVDIFTKHFQDVVEPLIERQRLLNKEEEKS
jgi:hypothetical protein